MRTLDAVLQEAESEAQKVGYTIRGFQVERIQSGANSPRNESGASDLPLLSVRQAARTLGRSESTVRGWCRDRTLPASKIGRSWFVSRAALERLGDIGRQP